MRNVFVLTEKVVTSHYLISPIATEKNLGASRNASTGWSSTGGVRHGAQCISSYAGGVIMDDNKFRYSIYDLGPASAPSVQT